MLENAQFFANSVGEANIIRKAVSRWTHYSGFHPANGV